MKNKCPNCGYEYGEFDIFCSRCGYKISSSIGENNSQENNSFENNSLENNLEALKQAVFNNAQEFLNEKSDNSKYKDFNSNGTKVYDNAIFNFAICLVIVGCCLSVILYAVLGKHKNTKMFLQYKNLITNPALIPELKEPSNLDELIKMIKSVNEFLILYLKYSSDAIDKKEQIFSMYLKEMEKLPHLTNEALVKDENNRCYKISSSASLRICTQEFNKDFKNTGIKTYSNNYLIYFYPDYKYIDKTYSKYLSSEMKEYLALRAKYNTPANINLELKISPLELGDKIYNFEKFFLKTSNPYIKEELEKSIFEDFRAFIFTPSIYATTTQEMTPSFKKAYKHYISFYKNSALVPVIMSYIDKKRAYNEENFKNDYPYKIFEEKFSDNIENSALSDVFISIRKKIFSDTEKTGFAYIYSIAGAKWTKYEKNSQLSRGQYIISEPDENNNITIYNNSLSVLQELNISKFSNLFIYNNNLFVFNSDRLSISKIQFNGRQFNIQLLSFSDVSSLFPGIEIINIDSYSNYRIPIEKVNSKSSYIILSKYSNGFEHYELSPLQGNINTLFLPNMFSVNSDEDIIISYHNAQIDPEGTSESVPTYKFAIYTKGRKNEEENTQEKTFANYDEQTAAEERSIKYEPNIMPKIIKNTIKQEEEVLSLPPEQKIEPPKEEIEN